MGRILSDLVGEIIELCVMFPDTGHVNVSGRVRDVNMPHPSRSMCWVGNLCLPPDKNITPGREPGEWRIHL